MNNIAPITINNNNNGDHDHASSSNNVDPVPVTDHRPESTSNNPEDVSEASSHNHGDPAPTQTSSPLPSPHLSPQTSSSALDTSQHNIANEDEEHKDDHIDEAEDH